MSEKIDEKMTKNDDFWPQKIPPNHMFRPVRARYLPWNRSDHVAPAPVCLCHIWNQVGSLFHTADLLR